MTKIFNTTFTINEDVPVVDLLKDITSWIEEGRRRFKKPDFERLEDILSEENCELNSENDQVKKLISLNDKDRFTGVRYLTLDLEEGKYSTDILIKTNLESNKKDVSIVLDYRSPQVFSRNNGVKIPIIAKTLFDKYAGAFDGKIPIHKGYHRLEDGDEHFVSDFLLGRGENKLPIVYLSVAKRTNQALINPRILAQELRSIAHVYLEPFSDYSYRMVKCLNDPQMSCFGGGVRVYWPGERKPHENKLWTKDDLKSVSGEFYNQIASKIIADYIVKSSIFQETNVLGFNELEQMHSRDRLKELSIERRTSEERKKELEEERKKLSNQTTKIEGLTTIIDELESGINNFKESETLYEDALNVYEHEVEDYKDKISEQKEEITNLYDELDKMRDYNKSLIDGYSQTSSTLGLDVDPSSITSDRIKEVLLYALDKSSQNLSSRYQQIVNLVLSAEEEILSNFEEERNNQLDVIESIFRNSQDGLSQKDIKIIERMGYTITKEGKHYKMKTDDDFFEESLTIPCTPEDHRAMKNNFSDLRKKFY